MGLYSEELIPVSRGFSTSFGYLTGGEDHYSQQHGVYNASSKTYFPAVDLWRDLDPAYGENGTYGAFMYTAEAVKRITQHKAKHGGAPMFLYLAYQNNHCPLQVPEQYQDPSINNTLRRIYHGMSKCLDEGIGNVTKALQTAGMYDDTW